MKCARCEQEFEANIDTAICENCVQDLMDKEQEERFFAKIEKEMDNEKKR